MSKENRFKLPFAQMQTKKNAAPSAKMPPLDALTFQTVLGFYLLDTSQAACDAAIVLDFIKGGDLAAAVEVLEKLRDDSDGRNVFIDKLYVAYGGKPDVSRPDDAQREALCRPFV